MKMVECMVYKPQGDPSETHIHYLEYTDSTLYKVIHEKRMNYPDHHITLYFYGRGVQTLDPLNTEKVS